jgi:hypothetical protein
MKRGLRVIIFVALSVGISFSATNRCFAQNKFAFGIKPGMTMQTSYFGFTAGKFLPYASMDLLWMTVNYTETNQENTNSGSYNNSYSSTYWEKHTTKGKAVLFIPHFGSKFYVYGSRASEGLRSYLNGDFYFSFSSVSGKEEMDWRNTYDGSYESGHSSQKLDKQTKDLVKDILSFWGFNLGFGAEYMFSEHFSVGGEYGFRLFFDKIKWRGGDSWSYGTPGSSYYYSYEDKWEDELALTLKMNYAVVAVNFYF